MIIGSVLLWVFNRGIVNYKKGVLVLLIAFSFNIPYLIYTFNLTGKILCWADNGGNNLYWMTTPYEKEYGDYYGSTTLEIDSIFQQYYIPGGEESRKLNHRKTLEEIYKYEGPERDAAWKKFSIENIKSHPLKYLQNCVSNVGRILFDFPISYKAQSPKYFIRLPFNGIIVVLALFCLIPTLLNWREVPYSIRFLLFIVLIYLGGSTLLTSETRMFTPIVPVLLIWIAFILEKSVIFKLKFDQ